MQRKGVLDQGVHPAEGDGVSEQLDRFSHPRRGGVHAPLSTAEVEAKFRANALYGGWTEAQADAMARALAGLFGAPDMAALAAGRG